MSCCHNVHEKSSLKTLAFVFTEAAAGKLQCHNSQPASPNMMPMSTPKSTPPGSRTHHSNLGADEETPESNSPPRESSSPLMESSSLPPQSSTPLPSSSFLLHKLASRH
uniref:Uncharacterized protein n=1 Tax=Arundo donax TaxID=35708 RepID=A0A0A9BIE9_ARUDO